ncbi:MAG: hypothetical protein RR689_03840 [Mucinivorans sp.]
MKLSIKLLLICFALTCFVSCQGTEAIIEPPTSDEVIQTSIVVSNEVEFGTELPMSVDDAIAAVDANASKDKSKSKTLPTSDIYGVQIYSSELSASAPKYVPYAYGLFDDLGLLSLGLAKGKVYQVVVTMVREGKRVIATNTEGAYDAPFLVMLRNSIVDNKFTYSTKAYFKGFSTGRACVVNNSPFGSESFDLPAIDRYAGEVSGFEPKDGQVLNIELKRVVFGIRLMAPDLEEGHIELMIDGAPVIVLNKGEAKVEVIMSLLGRVGSNLWIEDNYSEDITCTVLWCKADGSKQYIGSADGRKVTVKRKHILPITVKTQAPLYSASISIEPATLIEQSELIF